MKPTVGLRLSCRRETGEGHLENAAKPQLTTSEASKKMDRSGLF